MTIWEIIEIEPTSNISEIKKAYARKIKQYKPEIDPEGFQRVRNAYETAIKFAMGEQVSDEIICQEEEKNSIHAEEQTNEIQSLVPDDFVLDLLYLLSTGQEQEAIHYFQDMDKNGQLDNLEFAEELQELIVPRLIDKDAPEFTTTLLYYFQWQNHPAIDNESLFSIALRTLIKQTEYYRFLQELNALSLISTKAQAKEKGLDWNRCYAIRSFLSHKKQSLLALQLIFSRKKQKAINALLEELNSYRAIYGKSYLNDNVLSVWTKYGSTKLLSIRFVLWAVFVVVYIIAIGIKHNIFTVSAIKSSEQTIQNQAQTTKAPSTYTTVVINFSDYQGQKLNGANKYILNIPPVKNGINTQAIWTVMLFDKNYKPLKLINNSQTVLSNEDGSIDIYLQSEKPSQKKESNWIETPKDNFIIMGSFHWKKDGEIINHWDGLKLAAID